MIFNTPWSIACDRCSNYLDFGNHIICFEEVIEEMKKKGWRSILKEGWEHICPVCLEKEK